MVLCFIYSYHVRNNSKDRHKINLQVKAESKAFSCSNCKPPFPWFYQLYFLSVNFDDLQPVTKHYSFRNAVPGPVKKRGPASDHYFCTEQLHLRTVVPVRRSSSSTSGYFVQPSYLAGFPLSFLTLQQIKCLE